MASVKIVNKLPRLISVGSGSVSHRSVQLMPGANTLPSETWEKIKGLAVIKTLLDLGDLKETALAIKDGPENKSVAGGVDDTERYVSLKFPSALSYIKECLDAGLLRRWLHAEERPPVRKAIEQKLVEIDAQRKP